MKGLISFLVLIFCSFSIYGQKVVWADKPIDYVPKYQSENNSIVLALGPPVNYKEDGELKKPEDGDFYKGYILHEGGGKNNSFIVGFPDPMRARQIIIGGVFNKGVIEEVSIIKYNGRSRRVCCNAQNYKGKKEGKFRSFHVMFPKQYVKEVKLVIDHSKIDDWNIIKGIGISDANKEVSTKPDVIEHLAPHHTREHVGEDINSETCFEFSPKLTPDGEEMYFVKECMGDFDQDIYKSEKKSNNKWSDAVNVGPPLNNEGHNFVASVSLDGETLLLGNKYNEDGSPGGEGVSIVKKQNDSSWSEPQNLDIPSYQNKNDHANYFLGPEGKALLMAIEDENSRGSLDIYVSLYSETTNSWRRPKNLGTDINTPFAEDYPYLAPDRKTLYFSSKGYKGYGGHDIYMSKRKDDSWQNWTTPKNLGPYVNSEHDDKGFTIHASGDHAFLNTRGPESDRHHMDIFKINLPKELHQKKRVLVRGKVRDKESKEPIRSKVTFEGQKYPKDHQDHYKETDISSVSTGHYSVSLIGDRKYKVTTEAQGHFDYDDILDVSKENIDIHYTYNINIEPHKDSGDKFRINKVLFETGSAKLKPEAEKELDTVIYFLNEQPNSKIEVGGYTDNVGDKEENIKLSKQRAKAVRDYLLSQGVEKWRIEYKGYGPANPIASNDTKKGRRKNRRVEIKWLAQDYFESGNEKKKNNSKK